MGKPSRNVDGAVRGLQSGTEEKEKEKGNKLSRGSVLYDTVRLAASYCCSMTKKKSRKAEKLGDLARKEAAQGRWR